ncbi:MAG: benzoate/H(+) symporter BenE family transporter [Anaerolineae bacterium]
MTVHQPDAAPATVWGALRRNLRDLPGSIRLPAVLAGLVVVLTAYTGPILIIMEAAKAANLTTAETTSWIWAVTFVNGAFGILLSLLYRLPVVVAWPTAGAALLVLSLPSYPFPEAIGAYIVAGAVIALVGVTGLFSRAIELVPRPVVMGMLAGVLLRFGIGLFAALPSAPGLVTAVFVTFMLLRRIRFKAPLIGALVVGLIIAALDGTLNLQGVSLQLAVPLWTTPVFSVNALLGLALPLVALALTSQYAPGLAVLRSYGYSLPIDGALLITGIGSVLIAPFGGHGMTLAAITAAIASSPDAGTDPDRRYGAGVMTGAFYMVFGLFGATAVGLFTGMPSALIAAITGLALMGTIMNALVGSMAEEEGREGGLVALLCTGANFTMLGVGAPFWGLLFGVLTNLLMTWKKKS